MRGTHREMPMPAAHAPMDATAFHGPQYVSFSGLISSSRVATIWTLLKINHKGRFQVRMHCSERDFLRI